MNDELPRVGCDAVCQVNRCNVLDENPAGAVAIAHLATTFIKYQGHEWWNYTSSPPYTPWPPPELVKQRDNFTLLPLSSGYISTSKLQTASASETFVPIYQTVWRHISKTAILKFNWLCILYCRAYLSAVRRSLSSGSDTGLWVH